MHGSSPISLECGGSARSYLKITSFQATTKCLIINKCNVKLKRYVRVEGENTLLKNFSLDTRCIITIKRVDTKEMALSFAHRHFHFLSARVQPPGVVQRE